MTICINCNLPLKIYASKYCSNSCQKEYEYKQYIQAWKLKQRDGGRGKYTRNLSAHISKYIHLKYGDRCSLCKWRECNPVTGKSPLEIDHIDGDSKNNTEDNLILLCPNCHSLTSTYKNLNKGHGRLWRREKYVKIV